MSERFTKIYELPGGVFAESSPVLIRAGVLLRDAVSKNVIAQLKLYNLDTRTIKSVKIALMLWDAEGNCLGEELERSYTNLKAVRDDEFGHRTALVIPYREVCRFSVRVTRVVFADGTKWADHGEEWEPVEKQITLKEAYDSEEMAAQFRIRYGTDCRYAPLDGSLLWQCTCGAVNRKDEKSCHRCHRVRRAQLNVNEDSLRNECEQRLKEEALQRKQEEAAEPDEQTLRKRRLLKHAAVIIPLLLALVAVIHFGPRLLNRVVPLPVSAPAPSMDLVLPSLPPTPAPSPTPVPTPTLSPEEQRQADYDAAVTLLENGSYSAARAAFLKLDSYESSEEFAQEAVYRKAVALYSFIEQHDVEDIYAVLSMDPNGTNRFSLSTAKALELGSKVVDTLGEACGQDKVDFSLTDTPSQGLKPLAACVKDLFALLGDYKDSPVYLSALIDLTDYTRDFYMLCKAGDIFGAYEWLQNYTGEFSGRDHWLQLLDLYKPFCSDWRLYAGDITLLPLTVGHEFPCTYYNSRIIIDGDYATLRLLIWEGESEYNVDLVADTGSTSFACTVGNAVYAAAINNVGHMAYMKFANGKMLSSCEYQRAD
ncbi:MAG: hypothetical protein IKO83_11720 [Oscillospiraceae bacterium]|nr:hypothetical protein [Oscillospiraceae bacterium]